MVRSCRRPPDEQDLIIQSTCLPPKIAHFEVAEIQTHGKLAEAFSSNIFSNCLSSCTILRPAHNDNHKEGVKEEEAASQLMVRSRKFEEESGQVKL